MVRMRYAFIAAATLAACWAGVQPARAQQSPFTAVPAEAQPVIDPPGWTLTPSVTYGASYDDNVLVADRPEQQVGDLLNTVSPGAALGYNGQRGRFGVRYDGSVLWYRDLETLNGYDQRAFVTGQRALSPVTSLFVRGGAARTPTTELQDFVGVPFVRTGATVQSVRAGVRTRYSRYVSLELSGNLERVHFDENVEFASLLRGGHGLGGTAVIRRQISTYTALVGSYDVSRGAVGLQGETFVVQNGEFGFDHRLTESLAISGAAGVSHLSPSVFGPAHTDPNWRGGLSKTFRYGGIDATYARRFEASYGFAGTTRTDELAARAKADLPHGFYTRGGFAWRFSEPLTLSDLRFRSFWTDAAFGFATRPGILIEGFWTRTDQSVARPDAAFQRSQIGVHVIATRSMRIH